MPEPLAVQLTAKVNEAIAARTAGDLAAALDLYEQAREILAFIPDGTREAETFSFRSDDIERAIAALKRRVNASGGIVEMPLAPVQPWGEE